MSPFVWSAIDKKKTDVTLDIHEMYLLDWRNKMTEQLCIRLTQALSNHVAPCYSRVEFDPERVELHGVIPESARGLFALKVELAGEIKKLQLQIDHRLAMIKAAQLMAQRIVLDKYPECGQRQGWVIGKNWTFAAYGPNESHQQEAEKTIQAQQLLEEEYEKTAGVVDNDAVDAVFNAGLHRELSRKKK